MKFQKIQCKECKTVFVADTRRWHMDYCPGCHKGWVDFEEHYTRHGGNIKFMEEFDPPWFDEEDDYHSALLTWLNDSDEEYELEKDYGSMILTVIRL